MKPGRGILPAELLLRELALVGSSLRRPLQSGRRSNCLPSCEQSELHGRQDRLRPRQLFTNRHFPGCSSNSQGSCHLHGCEPPQCARLLKPIDNQSRCKQTCCNKTEVKSGATTFSTLAAVGVTSNACGKVHWHPSHCWSRRSHCFLPHPGKKQAMLKPCMTHSLSQSFWAISSSEDACQACVAQSHCHLHNDRATRGCIKNNIHETSGTDPFQRHQTAVPRFNLGKFNCNISTVRAESSS